MRAVLRDLAETDAALDAEMLKARDGLEPNFDKLVDTMAKLNLTLASLRAGRVGEFAKVDDTLEKSLEGLAANLRKKTAILDDLEYRHAVVDNSSRYFPRALVDARASASADAADAGDLESGQVA